jgi:hypothetical protein
MQVGANSDSSFTIELADARTKTLKIDDLDFQPDKVLNQPLLKLIKR